MNPRFKILLIVLLFWSNAGLFSQNTFTLAGRIIAGDYSPLVNATIYVSELAQGTFSDSLGEFRLYLKPGLNEIAFSYIGYKAEKLSLVMSHDTLIEIKMLTDLQLGEVTIVDKKKLKSADHDETGLITLRKENFLSLPALLGENDPMRAVQMQPGVQSGNEGARGIFVRGGSPDQNLMLLDGATVYNPSHLYGFTSVFNGDAIEKIDIYKDRYPARFGGRLGSVMDIESDGGNKNRLTGSISLGLLTSRVHIDGPLTKNKKTTFSLSARVCYAGLYTSPISKKQYKAAGYDGNISYYFGDANFKLAHRFNANDRIELSYFNNNDFYSFKKLSGQSDSMLTYTSNFLQTVSWANYVTSLGHVHSFNEKWELRTKVAFSDYQITSQQMDHYYQAANQVYGEYKSFSDSKTTSYIRDLSFNTGVTFTPNNLQTFRAGAQVKDLIFETGKGNASTDNTVSGKKESILKNNRITAIESSYYLEDEMRPNWHWLINFGFHASTYTVQKKTFVNFHPRLNVVYSPVKNLSLRASASGLSQNLHLLATSTSNVLNDYWVPATAVATPETGWDFSGGIMQKLPLNFEWSIDGFYRTMDGLIDYKEGATYASYKKTWEEQVETGGSGRAYGLELYVARSFGRITGSVAYTLAWSQRKFSTLNEGNYFPYKYDRRHNVALQLNFLASRHIELGLAWAYGSGNMFTMPLQSYNSYGGISYHDYLDQQGYTKPSPTEEITVYTGKNNYRLPAYHHLDLSFTYKKKVKKLEHRFNFSIYNVYSRMNIFTVYSDYRPDENGGRKQVFKQLSLFPILPSISYTIKFGV